MTTLHNEIHIDAPPEAVWKVLSTLDRLAEYDPGVRESSYTTEQRTGVGAARRNEVPGGFFEDVVTVWEENRLLDLELTACSFPVRSLQHRYTLEAIEGGTVVRQVQTYEMKWGLLGRLLDAVMIRRTWDAGVKSFLVGLKAQAESD